MKKSIVYSILILTALALLIWLACFLALKHSDKDPYEAVNDEYVDELGQQVKIVSQTEISIDKMKAAYNKSDSLRNEAEKKLAFAEKEINALIIKLKNAKSFTTVETSTTDTFTLILKEYDTVFIKDEDWFLTNEYTDGYLSQEIKLYPTNNKIWVKYNISDTIIIVDSWARKPNKKGQQSFFLWRWLKPWQVRVDVKSKNPNSTITNSEKLIFKNR